MPHEDENLNTKHLALFIPADRDEETGVVTASFEDYAHLIHGKHFPERMELDFATFRDFSTQACYDDLGLYREDAMINQRAMRLWAKLRGMRMTQYRQPLVGNFLFLGLDPWSGETQHVPDDIVALCRMLEGEVD